MFIVYATLGVRVYGSEYTVPLGKESVNVHYIAGRRQSTIRYDKNIFTLFFMLFLQLLLFRLYCVFLNIFKQNKMKPTMKQIFFLYFVYG